MIKFGTSGFRGIIADNFTKENVQKIAYAIAKTSKTNAIIPVGFDNRFMGKQFAMWLCEVLVAYGKQIKFFDCSVPSPVIAFETLNQEFGVMISASHNPYFYNGIKIFQTGGRELSSKQNASLEKLANRISHAKIKTIDFDLAKKQSLIKLTTSTTAYQNSILKNLNQKAIKQSGVKVYFNAMNGSSTSVAKKLFEKLNLEVKYLNCEVDPNFNFGLPAPYRNNLKDQTALAKSDFKEDFGFALDGDGDRISFLDENGGFYDASYLVALVYDKLCETKPCSIVKNCAMTALVDKIAEKYGQNAFLAGVGFKNTAQKMLEYPNALIGAESNGFAIKNHLLYKDGLMGALKIVETLALSKSHKLSKAIASLKKKYNFPCEVVEYAYPFKESQREEITKKVFKQKQIPDFPQKPLSCHYEDGAKFVFENDYWCVIRFSGNENVLRLFAEMPNIETAEKHIKIMEKFVGLKTRQ